MRGPAPRALDRGGQRKPSASLLLWPRAARAVAHRAELSVDFAAISPTSAYRPHSFRDGIT